MSPAAATATTTTTTAAPAADIMVYARKTSKTKLTTAFAAPTSCKDAYLRVSTFTSTPSSSSSGKRQSITEWQLHRSSEDGCQPFGADNNLQRTSFYDVAVCPSDWTAYNLGAVTSWRVKAKDVYFTADCCPRIWYLVRSARESQHNRNRLPAPVHRTGNHYQRPALRLGLEHHLEAERRVDAEPPAARAHADVHQHTTQQLGARQFRPDLSAVPRVSAAGGRPRREFCQDIRISRHRPAHHCRRLDRLMLRVLLRQQAQEAQAADQGPRGVQHGLRRRAEPRGATGGDRTADNCAAAAGGTWSVRSGSSSRARNCKGDDGESKPVDE
ncbi:hypothetical protein PWT90_04215 [Aphanocladium album]|nr:hypothetical protein PWT90_04215 [Aphanocladium album]